MKYAHTLQINAKEIEVLNESMKLYKVHVDKVFDTKLSGTQDKMDYGNLTMALDGSNNTEDFQFTTTATGEEYLFDIGTNGSIDLRVRDAGTLMLSDGTNTVQINVTSADALSFNSATSHNFDSPVIVDGTGEALGDGFKIQNSYVQTTDATVTTIITIATASDHSYLVTVDAIGATTSGATTGAYVRRAAYENDSGTLGGVGVGVTNVDTLEDAGAAAWDVTITTSGTNILIQVTGAAATTINWQATVQISDIGAS